MEDQEMKFVCKWCNKRYPCGKSLGGHIRTHMMINQIHHESDESKEKSDAHLKKMSFLNGEKSSCELGGQTSYGLRENPKKTIKAVETITSSYPMPNEKICRQCGKGFQSMKALCGHMAVHSEKDKGLKDDQSWTSEENDEKTVMEEDTDSDTESEERKLIRSKTMEKRYNNNKSRIMINSLGINNDSSSVSEIDEQEQEHVAMCLMMLSKDSSNRGGVMNSVVESSDNNSVVLETKSSSNEMRIISRQHVPKDAQIENNAETKKEDSYNKKLDLSQDVEEENSDSGYYLNEYVKDESDGSVDGFHRIASFFESKKRPKVSVQDKHMNKVLNEPCRKVKMKGSPDDADDEHPKSVQKKRKYECLNCKKIFNSFQALGGHRPCHKRSNNVINESNNYESEENSLEVENDPYKYDSRKLAESPPSKRKANAKAVSRKVVDKTINSKKIKTHECPYCHRIFKNGQALGGHKRSHFIGGNYVQNRYDQAPVYKEEQPELLDLNLPAPTEDEDGGDFVSCWKVGGTSRVD